MEPDTQKSRYYVKLTESVYSVEYADFRTAFFRLYSLLIEVIESVLRQEKQIFSSEFAKIEFVINEYSLNADLIHALRSSRFYKTKLRKNAKLMPKQNEMNYVAKTLLLLVYNIYGETKTPFAEKILSVPTRPIPYEKARNTREKSDFYNCYITGKFSDYDEFGNARRFFTIITDDEAEFSLYINDEWNELYDTLRSDNTEVNLLSVYPLGNNFEMQHDSLIIYEPGIILDVTELAGCYSGMSTDYRLFFLNLFREHKSSAKSLAGNIVNYMFDDVISTGNCDYKKSYDGAIKENYLSLFANSHRDPRGMREAFANLPEQFERIIKFVDENVTKDDDITLEASFISARYGIQGRLDYFAENREQPLLKDIIELKSGRAPSVNSMAYIGNSAVRTGMWYSQYAQVIAYNMLLDSTFKGRTGNSAVFYSSTDEFPVRNVVNTDFPKIQLVHLRNQITVELMKIFYCDSGIIDQIFDPDFLQSNSVPAYNKDLFAQIGKAFNTADNWKKNYLKQYFIFIIRNWLVGFIQTMKKSDTSYANNVFSDFWKLTPEEKVGGYRFCNGLELDEEKSDFEKMHLYFHLSNDVLTNIRKGEMSVLYNPKLCGGNPLNNQIIKVSMREITNDHYIVSLRNKCFPVEKLLEEKSSWIIDIFGTDTNIKNVVPCLSALITLKDRKMELLKGVDPPRIDYESDSNDEVDELNSNQNEILSKVIRAKDYFLIQGPPGTGKTSYMLRNIVKYFIEHEEGDILLLAYTNRATDEICASIRSLGYENISFRLGRRESSSYEDMLLCNIVANCDIRQTYRDMPKRRIVIGTVYTVNNNSDIFDFKSFKLAVIDEASQIMEPQIAGILCRVPKFVMIGDEKQLPAIVPNTLNFNKGTSGQHYDDFDVPIDPTISLFEKLLKACKENGWNDSFGILKYQARMHEEIEAFPNRFFYENKLRTLLPWQNEPFTMFRYNGNNSFFRKITSSRMVYINTPTENVRNANFYELRIVIAIINEYIKLLGDSFNDNAIGVICPFRAQGNEIMKNLPQGYRNRIAVDTVERFQGSERDVIIYSTAWNFHTQSNIIKSETDIDGQNVDRKLNVVITRARHQFIILGNRDMLTGDAMYNNLIEFIEQKGAAIDCSETKQTSGYLQPANTKLVI